jgi:hypothetical protein
MSSRDLLKPLNDIAYLCECGAQDYTGELKSELSDLCTSISRKAPGYEDPAVQAELTKLEQALDSYRHGDKPQGAMLLAGVSRRWWALISV